MLEITIREFENKDAEEVTLLVEKVFNKFIAKDFTKEGILYWRDDLSPEGLIESLHNNRIFIAETDSKIIGIVRIKEMQRISMFYVDEDYQGRGTGSKLMSKAIELFKEKGIGKSFLKSSLYAVQIYEKLGFIKNGEIKKEHGIIYQEMMMEL